VRGLTGSIATGKSTVAQMLKELGAEIIDADQISREVVQPGQTGWQQVANAFPEVINPDHTIDRQKLASIIFADKTARARLEAIIHPLVFDRIRAQGELLERQGKIVFADIPLLYETNCQEWLDEVWLVYVPEAIQLQRLMNRDHLSEAEALQRIRAQIPIEIKKQLADRVIDNSGSLWETKLQVDSLWHQIIE